MSSFLRESGTEARIQEFDDGTPTAADAAAAGCGLDQIVKSLVLVCDDKAVVALARRPSPRSGEGRMGARSGVCSCIASAAEVESATGFPPGAVAPFPLPNVDDIFMDRRLLHHSVVWAGAGSSRHMVGIAPVELGRLARAKPMDVVAD